MEYKPIPKERFEEVVKHLRDNFIPDEPLNITSRQCQNGEFNDEEFEQLRESKLKVLEENFSIIALTQDNQIAGVVLNGILKPGEMECSRNEINKHGNEHAKKIMNLIYGQNIKLNLFEKYQVKEIFDLRILSVDSKFRGQGIAKELVKRTIELAKNSGFKLIKAEATGFFSQKVLKSCGFETIHEVFYAEYRDETGKPFISIQPPHSKFEILIKKLI